MSDARTDTADAESAPMPRDFGWRYIGWLCWSNKLSLLFLAQSAILEWTADADLPKATFHHWMAAANIIGIILAQISRMQGVVPPPTKDAKEKP